MQHLPPRRPTDDKQEDDDCVTEPQPERPTLTAEQRQIIDAAQATLHEARQADLAAMDEAALILLVERLRSRLDDTLRTLDPE